METLKLELIKWVASLEDDTTIQYLKVVKDSADHDWWDDLTEEQKAGIQRGLRDVEEGRVTPHEEVKRKYAFKNEP
ncbi:MAG: hypothetical protein KDD36_11795 [Flavobacteriales bacterium]|nr:hypothetical protein [Flavobacteriales bacterium]